jgi:DNA-binding NarL/FixJ family response regulator
VTTDPIRILLVDDQPLLRTGFGMILATEPDMEVVGEAEDGVAAVARARDLRPDIVLMDIRMPRMDGVEATSRITADDAGGPPPRVLVLTTFDLDDYVTAAIRAGASGFLLKDAPPEDLVRAIRVVAAGDALLAPSVTRRLLADLAARPEPREHPTARIDDLTARELEVLRLVARGLSNAEIADELVVGETTVKTHVGHILMKLGLRDRVQAVVLAYEVGVVTPGV